MSQGLTHLDEAGSAQMVDVSAKEIVLREAVAEGVIRLSQETVRLVRSDQIAKGNVLTTAKIAAIQAAKRTAEWIPLCHTLPLTGVDIDFRLDDATITATSRVRTLARTGVEMEALTAVAAALLTIYDMCKAVDQTMVIGEIRLLRKVKGGQDV